MAMDIIHTPECVGEIMRQYIDGCGGHLQQLRLCRPLTQAARANALTAEQGLGERVSFQVADALHMPFSDGMDPPPVKRCSGTVHAAAQR